MLVFLVNVIVHDAAAASVAGDDPWDGRTLEWSIPSPPPEYNFAEIPDVDARDDFWHRKYTEDDEGRLVRLPAGGAIDDGADGRRRRRRRHDGHGIHMPSPSFYPLIVAARPARSSATPRCSTTRGSRSPARRAVLFGVYAWAHRARRPSRTRTSTDGAIERRAAAASSPAAAATRDHGARHARHRTPASPTRSSAMWLFLSSDCLFFGAFISTYLLYRGRGGQTGPTPKDVFNIPFTSVTSFILLMSIAHDGARARRDPARRPPPLPDLDLATALFGATFIGGQIYEFTEFYREGLNLDTSLFGSSFFVLTGFHGAHVTVGIIWLLSLWGLSMQGRLTQASTPRRSRSPASTGTSSTSSGS